MGGTLTAVAVIFWLYSVLGYPPAGVTIDPRGHVLIPFMPRAGLAIGLLGLSMFVSCGVWGTMSPVLRRDIAVKGALISGCALFLVLYGAGWVLVAG
jgi:hypothetical protein